MVPPWPSVHVLSLATCDALSLGPKLARCCSCPQTTLREIFESSETCGQCLEISSLFKSHQLWNLREELAEATLRLEVCARH